MPKAVYLERQQLWRGPGEDGVMAGMSMGVLFAYTGKTGVYAIRNTHDGKVYIGSAAVCIVFRAARHRNDLRRRKHNNNHLQSAWDKYGGNCFICEIIELTTPEQAVEREQYWMDHYRSYIQTVGYNKSPTAKSPLGTKHSEESRRKMTLAAKKRWENPENRRKYSEAIRGRKPSSETRQLLSQALKERWTNPEYREHMRKKISEAPRTAEWSRNLSKARKGKKLSAKGLAALKIMIQNRPPQTAEMIEKRAAKLRGRKVAPEAVEKTRAAHLGQKRSPEARAKMAAAQKLRRQRELENAKKREQESMGRTGGEGA